MEYRLPKIEDQEILIDYVNEHYDNNETRISASMGLAKLDFYEWVKIIKNNATVGNKELGKNLLYLCFDNKELIGLLSVRYELPEDYRNKYGDIGYSVRPSKRNKGFATEMLKYGLSICRQKGLKEVILGCYKDNIASATVIKNNGGVLFLENDNYEKGHMSQYYSIKIDI